MTFDELCKKWDIDFSGDGFMELSLGELRDFLDDLDEVEDIDDKERNSLAEDACYHIDRIARKSGLRHTNIWSRPDEYDLYDSEEED